METWVLNHKLVVKRCHTCGGNVKLLDFEKGAVCAYCNNYVQVETEYKKNNTKNHFNSETMIDENKLNITSALEVYIDHFCEDYDWDNYVYSNGLYVKPKRLTYWYL